MAPSELDDQLNTYLADVHTIEMQALAQMKAAPDIAGDPALESAFRDHLRETEEHERLVRERLDARGGSPSKLKDVAGTVSGKGFVLFAKLQPDTPGKLAAHAFSYEHMEVAAYRLLRQVAQRAGDAETAELALRIEGEERAMAERIASHFDEAAAASLRDRSDADVTEHLETYLEDAHAIEAQAIELLEKGQKIAGADELAQAFAEHLIETRDHARLLEERLEAHDDSPSKLRDAALRLGALNWGAFFAAQPDTPAKLAGFAYAFEHLEIASYELLERVAVRAGDQATLQAAERILTQERAAAEKLESLFGAALDATLGAGATA
jgi:ferritin-like metal-binding protein YciE